MQNPLKFAGEYVDATGLYYLRARGYDPLSGRLLSRDSVDAPISEPYVGAYVYAAARPTVFVDPSGKTFAFPDEAQSAAEEVTSSCNQAKNPNQRIRCSYRFLINRFTGNSKYPRKHSAGLVGNFWAETERDPLNPRTKEEHGGPGRGIAQWGVRDRWQVLRSWARRKRLAEWDLQIQLRFVWYELHTTELLAWRRIIATTTVEDAAINVRRFYERADPSSQRKRTMFALRVYRNY